MEIVSSIWKSKIRVKILRYLYEIHPSNSYSFEIGYHTKTRPPNIMGAIDGKMKRYRKDRSLIALGLVEEITENKRMRLFRITKLGKEVIDYLNKNNYWCVIKIR